MEIIVKILGNTSLWEVTVLLIIIYFLFQPEMLKNITRLKTADFEVELNTLNLKRSVEHLEVCLQALSWRSQKRREWPSPSAQSFAFF